MKIDAFSKNDFLWQAFANIEYGALTINLNQSQKKLEFNGKKVGPIADIFINDESIIEQVILGGDVAFGESYINAKWHSSDIVNLLTFLTINGNSLEQFFHAKKFKFLILFLKNFFKKNTLSGSKKNISYHYDLGNEFYELWLDKTMTYSSALFLDKNIDLQQAQIQKYQAIIDKLCGETILEIGCGWGGFIEQAAQSNYKITGLTLSQQQRNFALNRLKKYQSQVEIYLQDYRDEKGIYDNIVSIEMFEAVGQQYWHKYFQILNQSLRVNGKAILQIITIDEKIFRDYKNRVDFIQKHIFPGGVLPSKSTIHQFASEYNFSIKSELSFANDYVKTIKIWLENFDSQHQAITKLGFSEEFIRKWRFYLAYCIAGFSVERTSVVQFELIKKQ